MGLNELLKLEGKKALEKMQQHAACKHRGILDVSRKTNVSDILKFAADKTLEQDADAFFAEKVNMSKLGSDSGEDFAFHMKRIQDILKEIENLH